MLKKSEARTIVEERNTQVLKEKLNNAIAICENEISKEIEKYAQNGRTEVKVSIPTNIEMSMVMKYLEENGYTVTKLTNSYISIEW